MEIISELSPGRIHGLKPYLPWVVELSDGVDIPESPLGIPHPNAVAVATYLKGVYGVRVFPHVRLRDLGEVGLISMAYAARILGIDALVLLQGEGGGRSCSERTTEEAVEYVRSFKGLEELRVGGILTLKYPAEKIVKRGLSSLDFFLVMRYSGALSTELKEVLERIRAAGKKLYVYVLVETERNREVVESIGQPFVKDVDVPAFVEDAEEFFDGAIISVPKDREGMRMLLEVVRKK